MSEVSEIQASSELVQALQKSKLLDDLYSNEKTRGPLLKILKEQRPDLSIPEVDGPKAVREAIAPELEQMRKDNLEMRGIVAREKFKAKTRSTDEELDAILETEVKRDGVQNLDTAYELHQHRAAAAPRNTQHSPVLMPDSKGLFADPRGWARKEAAQAIEDFRRGKLY